jgi:hypothetical protein
MILVVLRQSQGGKVPVVSATAFLYYGNGIIQAQGESAKTSRIIQTLSRNPV